MRLVLAFLLLLVSACATLPDRGQLVMRDVRFPVRELHAASGLRVLVEQDTRRPVVAVVALVGGGSASDPQGREGLAHLVEHLTFRARTEGRPSRWGQLEAAGAARINASTSFDATVYQAMAPRESLGELLRIEGEQLVRPLQGLTPELFDVEREVVRNELRESHETGLVGPVLPALQKVSFPEDHPYARPVGGDHASLAALSLADAQAFTREHYQPGNTTLVIVGDVDPATVDALIARSLPAGLLGAGWVEKAEAKRSAEAPLPVPLNPRPQVLEVEASVPTPELYLGWTLPRGYDDSSLLQAFVERIVRDELSRALWEDGDIEGLSTSLIPGRRASLLVVRVVLHTGDHPERSAERVLDQLNHLWGNPLGRVDMLAASEARKRQQLSITTEMVLAADDILSRAVSRAILTHLSPDEGASSRSLEEVAGSEADRVGRFAYEYLQRERARRVLVRPLKDTVTSAVAPGHVTVLPPEEEVPTQVPLTPPPSVSGFRTLRLDTGLEVVIGATPGVPVATVLVSLHGGSATGEPRGVGDLADSIVVPGSFFQGRAPDFGLRSFSSVASDHASFGFSGAAGNLPNMLAMTAEQLSSLMTEESYLNLFRREALPYRQKAEAQPAARSARDFQAALYPQHPYGREALAADLDALSTRDVMAWVKRTYRPANAVVAIVGELDLDVTEKQVRTWLSSWTGPRDEPLLTPAPEPVPAHPARLLLTPAPGVTQTWVAWGCPLPTADAAAEARYDVMAELASRRLFRQVRASLGASYGLRGQGLVREGGAAHLEVQGAVESTQLVPALAAVRQTLEALSQGRWTGVEFEAARQRVNQEHSLSLGTSARLAQAVVDARGRGWPLLEVEAYTQRLTDVSSEALQRDFAWCAQHLVVSLRGEEPVIRAAAESWPR